MGMPRVGPSRTLLLLACAESKLLSACVHRGPSNGAALDRRQTASPRAGNCVCSAGSDEGRREYARRRRGSRMIAGLTISAYDPHYDMTGAVRHAAVDVTIEVTAIAREADESTRTTPTRWARGLARTCPAHDCPRRTSGRIGLSQFNRSGVDSLRTCPPSVRSL